MTKDTDRLEQDKEDRASILKIKLQKTEERVQKLEAALMEIFPVDVYSQVRPDVAASCNGNAAQLVEDYIQNGIHEVDLKGEAIKRKPDLIEYIKQAALLLSKDLQESRDREEKLTTALTQLFPVDLYKRSRPDVDAAYKGEAKGIIEHFTKNGIHEIDIKELIANSNNETAFRQTSSILRDINIRNTTEPEEFVESRKISLLKVKGNKSNLYDNQDHIFSIRHTSIHYKSNSVCTWIPKNGCSNIRYTIAKENGAITGEEDIEWIHQNNESFNATTKEALTAKYTFVILRNPFKRLLSFFLDKACHLQQVNESDQSYSDAKDIFMINQRSNFLDFINHIWENPHTIYQDIHTRPQCDFLLYRNYDNYFALESINEAYSTIYDRTGIRVIDTRDINSIFTTKGCEKCETINSWATVLEVGKLLDIKKVPIVENMYTDEMIKKVATLYLQDILLYCSEIENGTKELNYWIHKAI